MNEAQLKITLMQKQKSSHDDTFDHVLAHLRPSGGASLVQNKQQGVWTVLIEQF